MALALLACSGEAGSRAITPAELLALPAAPLVLDVRSPEEFAGGHVPGAQNVAFDRLAAQLAALGPPRDVVVYCERGPRAEKAGAVLAAAGFAVKRLAGDMAGWRAAGLPIER